MTPNLLASLYLFVPCEEKQPLGVVSNTLLHGEMNMLSKYDRYTEGKWLS